MKDLLQVAETLLENCYEQSYVSDGLRLLAFLVSSLGPVHEIEVNVSDI